MAHAFRASLSAAAQWHRRLLAGCNLLEELVRHNMVLGVDVRAKVYGSLQSSTQGSWAAFSVVRGLNATCCMDPELATGDRSGEEHTL
jgi:hypothetical protein